MTPLEATITKVDVERLPEGASLGIVSPRPRSRGVLPFAFLLEGLLTADTDVSHLEVWLGQRMLREVAVKVVTEHRDKSAPEPRPGLSLYSFSTLVGTLRMPTSFTVQLRVVLASGVRLELGSITGTRPALTLPPGTTPRLSPMMMTSLGRTGGTWLMRLLSEHPELVLDARYPFESQPQRFWTHWIQVMSEPANHRESSRPNGFHTENWSVGANPFFTAKLAKDDPALALQLAGDHVVSLAGFAHQSAENYYLACMARLDRPNARFSVEKHLPDVIPALLWELYPGAKEIFLVRDPRDMLASMIAFNEKRGTEGFGREWVESDADFVRQLGRSISTLVQNWRGRRERAHLVRYEDLLTTPENVLREMFEYVGIDASAETAQRILRKASGRDSALASHQTSSDQGASMGRWERDLPAEIQALCSEEFAPALDEFGYSR